MLLHSTLNDSLNHIVLLDRVSPGNKVDIAVVFDHDAKCVFADTLVSLVAKAGDLGRWQLVLITHHVVLVGASICGKQAANSLRDLAAQINDGGLRIHQE